MFNHLSVIFPHLYYYIAINRTESRGNLKNKVTWDNFSEVNFQSCLKTRVKFTVVRLLTYFPQSRVKSKQKITLIKNQKLKIFSDS